MSTTPNEQTNSVLRVNKCVPSKNQQLNVTKHLLKTLVIKCTLVHRAFCICGIIYTDNNIASNKITFSDGQTHLIKYGKKSTRSHNDTCDYFAFVNYSNVNVIKQNATTNAFSKSTNIQLK